MCSFWPKFDLNAFFVPCKEKCSCGALSLTSVFQWFLVYQNSVTDLHFLMFSFVCACVNGIEN